MTSEKLGRCSRCHVIVYRRHGIEQYKSGHPHPIHRKGYTIQEDPPEPPDHGHRGWMDHAVDWVGKFIG